MRRFLNCISLLIGLAIAVVLTGCGLSDEQINELAQTRAVELVAVTLTARPDMTAYPTQPPIATAAPWQTEAPLPTQTSLPTQLPYETATPYPTFTPTSSPTIAATVTTSAPGQSVATAPVATPADFRQRVIDALGRTRTAINEMLQVLQNDPIRCAEYVAIVDGYLAAHQPLEASGQPLDLQGAYNAYLDFLNQMQTGGHAPYDLAQDCRALLASDAGATVPAGINSGAVILQLQDIDPEITNWLRQLGSR